MIQKLSLEVLIVLEDQRENKDREDFADGIARHETSRDDIKKTLIRVEKARS